MLKMFYRKFNQKKDYRFVDAEVYRKQRKSLREDKKTLNHSEHAALKVNFCSISERTSSDELKYFFSTDIGTETDSITDSDFIQVDTSPEKQSAPKFMHYLSDAHYRVLGINNIDYVQTSEFQQPFNYFDEIQTARTYRENSNEISSRLPKLGVFSDNKAYSAFLKTELSKLNVDLQHFNHPNSFKPDNYPHLDTIDAWVVFLSDEAEENFLDEFLGRYIDKPTLFLMPKTKRKTSSLSISKFVTSIY